MIELDSPLEIVAKTLATLGWILILSYVLEYIKERTNLDIAGMAIIIVTKAFIAICIFLAFAMPAGYLIIYFLIPYM
jgi:hypothetical protein